MTHAMRYRIEYCAASASYHVIFPLSVSSVLSAVNFIESPEDTNEQHKCIQGDMLH